MVGHGDRVVLPLRLAGIPAVFILRATALLPPIDVVGATITVNSANESSTMMAKITDVPFKARVRCPPISTGCIVTAGYKAVVVAYRSNRTRIPADTSKRIAET